MNTPQVSVWVPIIVGAIGVVGVIIGQLISTRREDRRWTREQAREDVRWKREAERDALERAAADRALWRDKKFEVYTEFLEFMKTWSALNDQAARAVKSEKTLETPNEKTLRDLTLESFEHRTKIDLIATDRAAQDVLLRSISSYHSHSTRISCGMTPQDVDQTLDEYVDINEETIDVVVAAIRVDLGISDNDDQTYLARIRELTPKETENLEISDDKAS